LPPDVNCSNGHPRKNLKLLAIVRAERFPSQLKRYAGQPVVGIKRDGDQVNRPYRSCRIKAPRHGRLLQTSENSGMRALHATQYIDIVDVQLLIMRPTEHLLVVHCHLRRVCARVCVCVRMCVCVCVCVCVCCLTSSGVASTDTHAHTYTHTHTHTHTHTKVTSSGVASTGGAEIILDIFCAGSPGAVGPRGARGAPSSRFRLVGFLGV
jgi:hypothetical protein